jgi:hypothetical protein
MISLTVHLTPDEVRVLRLVAQRERRSLRLQAAVMIRQGLEHKGLLNSVVKKDVSNEQTT